QLYIEANAGVDLKEFAGYLYNAVQDLSSKFAGLDLEKLDENLWRVEIPEAFKVGHEAHFGQVAEKYLNFLVQGKMPEWEVPNMIMKYYTTTEGLKAAMK